MLVRRAFLAIAFAGAVWMGAGCGGKKADNYKVFGTVTFQGQPLQQGVITFTPADGRAGVNAVWPITEGKYESPRGGGLPPGKYKVMISAAAGSPAPKSPDEPPGVSELQKELIPEKYNVKSDIIREVQPNDNNQFDFDLK